MNDDVRVIIATMVGWAAPSETGEYPTWDQLTDEDQEADLKKADAILTVLADAGWVVVERERFERLRVAAMDLVEANVRNAFIPENYRNGKGFTDEALLVCGLQPGDLDPLPERGD